MFLILICAFSLCSPLAFRVKHFDIACGTGSKICTVTLLSEIHTNLCNWIKIIGQLHLNAKESLAVSISNDTPEGRHFGLEVMGH